MKQIKVAKAKRLFAGHQWVFSNELAQSPAGFTPGELVELYDNRDDFLGIGYINPQSLISVRVLTRQREEIVPEFFKKRILAAARFRERFFVKGASAFRLVYSESDRLPGLIVDKYNDVLAVQILTAGMEAMKDTVLDSLDSLFSPRAIVSRNDSRIRMLEGLPLYKEISKGELYPLPVIEEEGVKFEVDPLEGQKTGFFLDQRENRTAIKALIRGGTGLDLFSYAGGWGVHLAHAGAGMVTCVDESEKALAMAKRNAELNGVSERMEFIKEDVFNFLKARAKTAETEERIEKEYDFIVLDPPAFVKSAKKLKEAVKAYTLLNGICMRLLKPGGLLATSSCSWHLGHEEFMEMLREAARKHAAGRKLDLLEVRSQGRDHPALLSMPETAYLKCAFLAVD